MIAGMGIYIIKTQSSKIVIRECYYFNVFSAWKSGSLIAPLMGETSTTIHEA
jgi:hypothetical protein